MAIYGYARVSTTDQDLTLQEQALGNAGCEIVRSEKASGSSRNGRIELATLLQFVRSGDTLVVTRIDRLARSLGDLLDIVRDLNARGVRLRATEQPFDTGDIYGEMLMALLGVFADFENKLRRERQMEGIVRAKAQGVYKGRLRSLDRNAILTLRAQGVGATAIARHLGVARASVYRVLAEEAA
jgi:DNA invertase Pin-like site-specific DNA recombinase